MLDDLISDRKINFLLERLKGGGGLIQGPEDVAIEVINDVKEETREKWKGAPIEQLEPFREYLRKQRRGWKDRAERLKETGVGENVEEARASARLKAKVAKWQAEVIGGLLTDIQREGPQTEGKAQAEKPETSEENDLKLRLELRDRDKRMRYIDDLRVKGERSWKEAWKEYDNRCEEWDKENEWSSPESLKADFYKWKRQNER